MQHRHLLQTKCRKRGDVALLWVVLALIVVTAFQGHVNILNQTSVVNEFQQQMDVSGLNALNKNIDIVKLQQKEDLFGTPEGDHFLANYEKAIIKSFKEDLYKSIRTNDHVTNVEVISTQTEFIRTEAGKTGNQTILLDGVVRITMKTFGTFHQFDEDDLLEEFALGNGGNTTVQAVRKTTDGQVQLFLHNQTRMNY